MMCSHLILQLSNEENITKVRKTHRLLPILERYLNTVLSLYIAVSDPAGTYSIEQYEKEAALLTKTIQLFKSYKKDFKDPTIPTLTFYFEIPENFSA